MYIKIESGIASFNEPDGYYQLDMDKYLSEKDIILNPPMKVQSIEAVKRCVMNNLGIAVVPTYSIGEELKKRFSYAN